MNTWIKNGISRIAWKNCGMVSKASFATTFFVLSFMFSVVGAHAASSLETQGTSVGLSIATSGGKSLESVIGEVSGSSMAASSKGLYSGHSRTSHSPGVVYDLAVATLSKTEVKLDWTGVGRDGLEGQASYVEIKIATFPVTYANYSTVSSSLTLDALSAGMLDQEIYSNLESGKTYYVAIRVRDSANMYGRISTNSTFATEAIKPKAPMVTGVLSGSKFTISWSAVTLNTEGGAIAVQNYKVYSSTSISGVVSAPISLSSSTLSYMAPATPLKWFFVKTVDTYTVTSDASIWLSNSDEVARTVADDAKAYVNIPTGVSLELSNSNLLSVLVHQPEKETGAVLSSYRLYFKDASNNIVSGRDYSDDVTLVLPVSNVGGPAAASINTLASYSDYDYAVYLNNGVEDVKLGGTVNSNGTISVSTKKTGTFSVKRVIRAQSFVITQTVPRKIFSPNGDGVWDEFNILFENPEGLSITGAKVYDLRGTEIANLVSGTYSGTDSLMWDGKKGGSVAQSGIYIYQFKAGNKHYNGTMVLAK
jgi:hypothetical protein